MRSPVSQAESSEARKTATRAISSGFPSRPIGRVAAMIFAVSPSMPATASPSVSVMPGAIALTRILRLARSSASAVVIVSHRKHLNQTRIKVEDFSFWPRNNFGLEPV